MGGSMKKRINRPNEGMDAIDALICLGYKIFVCPCNHEDDVKEEYKVILKLPEDVIINDMEYEAIDKLSTEMESDQDFHATLLQQKGREIYGN